MTSLATDRLILRPWSNLDRAALAQMATDPEMVRYVTDGVPWSEDRIDAFLDRQAGYFEQHGLAFGALEHRATGEVIGLCGIQPLDNGEFELGWWIWKPHWGHGYATEAGRAVVDYARSSMGLDRLVAVIDPPNAASMRVAEKLGLRFEKTMLASATRAERDDKEIALFGVRFERENGPPVAGDPS